MSSDQTAQAREEIGELQRMIDDFRRELGIVMAAAPRQKRSRRFRRPLRGARRNRRQATVA
jgi:hypothetical protein